MKTIINTITLVLLANFASGQVAIGKTSVDGNYTLLDFNDDLSNVRGIILPSVDNAPTLTSNNHGTFVFDKSDNKVKMYENGAWVDLTDEGNSDDVPLNNSIDNGGGAIIGAETSMAQGVLVLESDEKALILPKIQNPHINVKNPYPGMICYDKISRTMAVFDGVNWSFWK